MNNSNKGFIKYKKIYCNFSFGLYKRTGVSRCIETLCQYFNTEMIIMTDKYYDNFLNEIGHSKIILTSKIKYSNILNILNHIRSLYKIITSMNIILFICHDYESLIMTSLVKLLFPFYRIKLLWFSYDKEDFNINIIFKNFLKYLIQIKIIDGILVLDTKMKNYIYNEFKSKIIYVIRLGISKTFIENYERINKINIEEKDYIKKKYGKLISEKYSRYIKLYFHGILIPRRRIEDLLVALSILINSTNINYILFISGSETHDIYYSQKIKKQIELLKIKNNVFFLGPLNEFDLALMYNSIDIFVFPCEEQSWGLAPLEALFYNKPVIVSSGCGVSEVLNSIENTFISHPKNPINLVDGINKLIQQPSNISGHNFITKNFTYLNTGLQLKLLFTKLINNNRL